MADTGMTVSRTEKRNRILKLSWSQGFKLASFFTLIFLIVIACYSPEMTHYFPIKTVKVIGLKHTPPQDVKQWLSPYVNKGFFTVKVDIIRDRLIQFPWVADAAVRRVWPDTLFIQVNEKVSVARWNKDKLLSATGQLFSPSIDTYPQRLPQFIGPPGKHLEMLDFYNRLQVMLSPLQSNIAEMDVTSTGGYHLILENGIKLSVGRKDILTRVNDFVKVYSKVIGDRSQKVDSVDLRYSNGLAVRWKTA